MRRIIISATAILSMALVTSQVAPITSLPDVGEFVYQGCFVDLINARAIPVDTYSSVKTAKECRIRAERAGVVVFGLQNNGQCFIGGEQAKYD